MKEQPKPITIEQGMRSVLEVVPQEFKPMIAKQMLDVCKKLYKEAKKGVK